MSRMFGIGQKESKEREAHDYEQLCKESADVSEKIAYLQELANVFDAFPGWEAFRQKYLVEIRLPKLNAAAAKALAADDKVRNRLAGQIAEAEFLSMSKEQVKSGLERLTLRLKDVESRLMHEDSHKQWSAE